MGSVSEKPLCTRVVEAVASAEGTFPRELNFVLHDHVDTDALELLGESGKENWELSFEVPNHAITVRSDGTIRVDGQEFHENW